MTAVEDTAREAVHSREMGDAIVALAGLPLYSFDEIHPFARTRVVISCSETVAHGNLNLQHWE